MHGTDVLACMAVGFSLCLYVVASRGRCLGCGCSFDILVLFFGA